MACRRTMLTAHTKPPAISVNVRATFWRVGSRSGHKSQIGSNRMMISVATFTDAPTTYGLSISMHFPSTVKSQYLAMGVQRYDQANACGRLLLTATNMVKYVAMRKPRSEGKRR